MMKCAFGLAAFAAGRMSRSHASKRTVRLYAPQSAIPRAALSALHRGHLSSQEEKRKSSRMTVSKIFAARADSARSLSRALGSLQHVTQNFRPLSPGRGSLRDVGVIMPHTSNPAWRNASRSSMRRSVDTDSP